MLESTMPIEQPREATSAQEDYRELNRRLTQQMLNRAASDPTWKQQLLDDPEAAMRAANFPEIQRLAEMRESVSSTSPTEEVVGHCWYTSWQPLAI
jgi:hypothetical protein